VRIERITIKNYRQYQDVDVRLPGTTHDIHAFIAMNGTGKSNLVNAINWCLYGDEPHLSDVSKSLPIPSLGAIKRSRGEVETSVRLELRDHRDNPFTFCRRVTFDITNSPPVCARREFQGTLIDDAGNTKILSEQDAQAHVERMLPRNLRGFFLFDGERLENYFKRETGQQIRNSVFEISQVALLKRMEDRLREIIKDLAREAGKHDPALARTQETLERAQAGIDELNREIEQTRHQVAAAQDRVKELNEKLASLPDIKALEERRKDLTQRVREDLENIREFEATKRELIVKSYTTLALRPALAGALETIIERQERGDIPPSVDPSLLRDALRQQECLVCGRRLDEQAEATIRRLLEDHRLSTHIGMILLAAKHPLQVMLAELETARSRLKSIRGNIKRLSERRADLEAQIAQIDTELAHHDLEVIRQLQAERSSWEQVEQDKLLELGRLKGQKDIAENLAKQLRRKRDVELRRKARADQLDRQIRLANEALQAIQAAREEIMSETRSLVAEETNRLFFKLIWKKHSFRKVTIGEDYSLSVTHNEGFECMGSLSAAETELLALSFTLALHHVSGFESPLLIDTPVARVSDINRKNFASVLADVSRDKQSIVLFAPSEYSAELANVIDPIANKHRLVLADDELSIRVEE